MFILHSVPCTFESMYKKIVVYTNTLAYFICIFSYNFHSFRSYDCVSELELNVYKVRYGSQVQSSVHENPAQFVEEILLS